MSEEIIWFPQNFPEFISCSISVSFHKLKIFEQFCWLMYEVTFNFREWWGWGLFPAGIRLWAVNLVIIKLLVNLCMYHIEFQFTLRFTDLSCNRLLVVTTDYTLVLYLCRGEGSTYRNRGKTASLYMFWEQWGTENNGKRVYCSEQLERTMGRESIVLNNRKEQWKECLLFWIIGIKNNALHWYGEQWLLIADNEQCFIVY
jgi:hypothetical protein